MRSVTMVTGMVLILIGLGAWGASDAAKRGTALIPAYLGFPILLMGLLAARESIRMHVMHVAVLLALLGAVGSLGRAIPAALGDGGPSALALGAQLATGLVCLLYVGLAVRSFIAARRAREAAGG